MRTVYFIGIGAEKAATSWLYSCLIEHPQICGGIEKEMHYFDTVRLFDREDRVQSQYDREGIEPYLKNFSGCKPGTVCGEFTVTYLHDARTPDIIKKHFPEVKLIAILRNPIDRAFSQYMAVKHMLPYRSFEEAIEKEPEFIRRSTYAPYLAAYYERFPKEHIHVTRYDDIRGREVAFIQDVYRFLGVSTHFEPQNAHKKERTSNEKHLVSIRRSIARMPGGSTAIDLLHNLGLTSIAKNLLTRSIPKESIMPNTRQKLIRVFAPDIEQTEELTGLNLTSWKSAVHE